MMPPLVICCLISVPRCLKGEEEGKKNHTCCIHLFMSALWWQSSAIIFCLSLSRSSRSLALLRNLCLLTQGPPGWCGVHLVFRAALWSEGPLQCVALQRLLVPPDLHALYHTPSEQLLLPCTPHLIMDVNFIIL